VLCGAASWAPRWSRRTWGARIWALRLLQPSAGRRLVLSLRRFSEARRLSEWSVTRHAVERSKHETESWARWSTVCWVPPSFNATPKSPRRWLV